MNGLVGGSLLVGGPEKVIQQHRVLSIFFSIILLYEY